MDTHFFFFLALIESVFYRFFVTKTATLINKKVFYYCYCYLFYFHCSWRTIHFFLICNKFLRRVAGRIREGHCKRLCHAFQIDLPLPMAINLLKSTKSREMVAVFLIESFLIIKTADLLLPLED